MPANRLEVQFTGDDSDLQRAVARSTRTIKGLGNVVQGIGLGVGVAVFSEVSSALSDFVGGATEEFLEAERAVAGLQQSLEAIGRGNALEGFLKQAQDIAKAAGYLDNDDVTNAFQKLIQVGGLTEKQINELIPVIVDLNAKQRLAGDVNRTVASTADDIVKGLSGSSRELKKYGIELKASNSEAENLTIILDRLGPKVQGAADAFGATLQGNLQKTTQKFKDLQEELGGKLLPAKVAILSFARDLADGFQKFFQVITGGYESFKRTREELEKVANIKVKAADFAAGFDEATSQKQFDNIIKFYNKLADGIAGAIAKTKDKGEPASQFQKDELERYRQLVAALEERKRLLNDKSTFGQFTEDDNRKSKSSIEIQKEQIRLLKEKESALKNLVQSGVNVSNNTLKLHDLGLDIAIREAKITGINISEAIQAFQNDFEKQFGEKIPPAYIRMPVVVDVSVEDAVTKIDSAANQLAAAQQRMVAVLQNSGKQAGDALRASADPIKEAWAEVENVLQGAIAGGFEALGQSLGNALSGGDPLAPVFEFISTLLQQLGKALIAYGVIQSGLKASLESLNGPLSIALGIAAIAAAAVVKNLSQQRANKFAQGGIVFGPTLGLVGEAGPEAIIPLNRADEFLGGGNEGFVASTRLDGRDIILVVERVMANLNRTGR